MKKRARDQNARDEFRDLDSSGSERVSGRSSSSAAAAAAGETGSLPYATGPQQGFQDLPPPVDPYAPVEDLRPVPRDTRPPSDAIETVPAGSSPGAAAGGVVGAGEKAEYDAARAQLDAGQYASAARAFAEFVRKHPEGDLTSNALYWLGESYYVTQNFQIALDTFRDLVARFPDSNKVADAMLKIGYCHFELQQFDDAEVALNEVITRYPDTTVARLAQGRLRALQTERGAR
ncbi:MAG: tol-pal system protein YbgF [Lysobacterales bacterium]